ncbi:uncharacterized protein BJ212DRAFT_1449281 [Suillus subaureus]|uniref:Sacsin/Nov domain-containing protein n=1 Tax=Suillus subaureus TaxID=48587 RepID=A0A9P7E0B7_9AGAM|nr:uncharacterized protein BJ212DRAFT_1449281 [Suillus subaureus]KAG1807427.1 hypothetical protein BJ212DRAFT_1449281 [Suillus subaureus]
MARDRDALWASGYDETVEVNQRALIDKVLARYSGEFTVFRELLQNSDDAQSSAVEIHFETEEYLRRKNSKDAMQPEDGVGFPDLKTTPVSQWTFRNNGIVFRDEDWNRLRKIAEGNPDEEKIGAFGVGFYSLFSVTEEPFVISGGHGMQFYWKDKTGDQLLVRRGDLPSKDVLQSNPWTSFEMTLREQGPVPQPFDLTRFLASSITFMVHLRSVSVFLDSHRLAHLTKSPGVPRELGLLKGLKKSSGLGLMSVKSVQSAATRIQAQVMHAVYDLGTEKPLVLPVGEPRKVSQGGFFSSLLSTFTSHHQPVLAKPLPQPQVNKDPTGVYTSSVTLTMFNADVDVKLDKKLQSELHRSTKKNPPNHLNYSLIYTGKDEYNVSIEEEKSQPVSCGSVFQGLRADLNGAGQAHVFIGHATGQTTGIGGHMASRFIPTVERESIDLVDRNVAVWNRELLYVGGYLCRAAYEMELENIRVLWNEATSSSNTNGFHPDPQLGDWLRDRFLHVLKFFTFHVSTPSSDVARFLEAAFFSCSTLPLKVLSTTGVRDASDVRAPDPMFSSFLKHLPVLPAPVLSSAPLAIRTLQSKELITDITFSDVLAQLRQHPLNEEELIDCLKWWVGVGQQDPTQDTTRARTELLNATILSLGSGNDARPIPLSMVQYFIHQRMILLDGPLPDTLMPLSVTKHFTQEQLRSFGWREFSILDWIQHIFRPDVMNANPEQDVTRSSEWAERVLIVLARTWPSLSKESHEKIKVILTQKSCIPTSSGLQKPQLAYFPSANIFNDLPVVTFTSGGALKGNVEKLLSFVGVRKHVDLQVVFDRMVKTGDWTISDLITHLVTIQSTLTADEITKLQMTSAFSKEGENALPGKKSRYRASDLYEPSVTNRQLGLPIIDWGEKTKWRSSSEEAKLLHRLGLRKNPPLDLTVKLCASSEPDIRSAAFKYLIDSIPSKYPEYKRENFSHIAFIPAVNDFGPYMGTPNEVFTSHQWKVLGFSVIEDTVRDIAVSKLGLKEHPPATRIVALLEKTPPQDQNVARRWFEILAGHVADFSSSQLSIISALPIVPTQVEPGSQALRWLSPSQCYLGGVSKGQFHSKLFVFVDFGPSANSFLSACGSKQEPSVEEVANILVTDPRRFYDLAGGYENYLVELRNLAVNTRLLSTGALARMKISPILLGFRRQRKSRKESNKALDLDEDDWELLYDLRKPLDVVIADDTNAYQIFGESIYTAPQEDLVENFYATLGSKRLSAIVKEDYRVNSEIKHNKSAADTRALLLERLPLFLHEHTHARTKVSLSWLSNQENFKVRVFGKLTVVKSLSFGDNTLKMEQDASAAAKRSGHGPIELWLSGSTQVDMYEVATSLCRLLFETVKVNDALLFMTILSTDLKALKRRGYNVDKILRQQQNDRKLMEAARGSFTSMPVPDPRMSQSLEPETRSLSPSHRARVPGGWDTLPPKAIASKPFLPPVPAPPLITAPAVPPPKSSTPDAPTQHTVDNEDVGRHPMIPNVVNNTLQNIRRKIPGFNSPSEDALTPSRGRSPNLRTPPTVTPQSNIRSNVAMAIKGCRPEEGKLVHNRREMQMIKESLNEGYCDVSGHVAELDHNGVMGTMKIFIARDVPEPHTFIARKRDSLARFIHIVTPLASVYSLPMTAVHIFYDLAGGLIAFNRNGSLFLNYRFFEAWHDQDVKNGDINQAYISWYFTLAHEIAHNLVQPHNSEHEFYFSALCEAHIEKFTQLLSQ